MAKRLTEQDIANYKLSEQEVVMYEQLGKMMNGEEAPEFTRMSEFLATPSAQILVPRIIIGAMRQAAEPLYIGSKMLKKIRLKQGQSMIFPYMGIIRAYDIAEGRA